MLAKYDNGKDEGSPQRSKGYTSDEEKERAVLKLFSGTIMIATIMILNSRS